MNLALLIMWKKCSLNDGLSYKQFQESFLDFKLSKLEHG